MAYNGFTTCLCCSTGTLATVKETEMADGDLAADENSTQPGNPAELGELLQQYEARLLKIVAFRMDRRLRARIDPADVLQEAFVEATKRYAAYAAEPPMPFFLWLRYLTLQTLFDLHRRHVGAQARDVRQEVSMNQPRFASASSAVLAHRLLGTLTSPSDAAVRNEQRERVVGKLEELDPVDREILVLRHFEQLSNAETARVLDIQPSAASNRYVRAIRRLKSALER